MTNKYHAKPTYSELCGRLFDSKAEKVHGEELALLEQDEKNRQAILESISETKLRDEMVIPLIKTLGLNYYFTFNSLHSPAGYPDLTIWGKKIIWRELKKEKGAATLKQVACLVSLNRASGDADFWTPGDWHSGRIERELRELV